MEGNMLEAFHNVYRVSLDVAAAQAADRCCACGRTAEHSYSEGGAIDYRRTGVCEYCFDVLHDPAKTTLDRTTQCNNLTADGCAIAKDWIAFSRSRRRLLFQAADFRRAVELTLGLRRPQMHVAEQIASTHVRFSWLRLGSPRPIVHCQALGFLVCLF